VVQEHLGQHAQVLAVHLRLLAVHFKDRQAALSVDFVARWVSPLALDLKKKNKNQKNTIFKNSNSTNLVPLKGNLAGQGLETKFAHVDRLLAELLGKWRIVDRVHLLLPKVDALYPPCLVLVPRLLDGLAKQLHVVIVGPEGYVHLHTILAIY